MSETLSEDVQKFLASRELFGWQLGLQRMRRLARFFNHPERRFRAIHIAGSNGKGSVAAMLEAVLMASGYRTGLYTSPHLAHLSERIRIAGAPIPASSLENLLAKQRWALQKYDATYFETLTSIAFSAFSEAEVDIAVVEVGLGGRLDATNIVKPQLCIITTIAREHQKFLGRTLAEIAREKAGILKRGVPCVVGHIPPRAMAAIRASARQRNAPLFEASQRCTVGRVKVSESGNSMTVRVDDHDCDDLHCKLIGHHQVNNALCALVAVHLLRQRGFAIPEASLRAGLERVDWPGRFHILPQRPCLIFDAAHNPAGMKALVRTYRHLYPGGHPIVVLGVLIDKDYVGMLRQWRGVAARLIACQVQSDRARPAADLYRAATQMELPAELVEEPEQALRHAATLAGAEGMVCVTGSHYLVGRLLPTS